MFSVLVRHRHTLRRDVSASLVVFLIALPLCVGIAVASGMPAEAGLVTGIIGGLLVGVLPGSSLQVSGPAAGLTVLVFEAVREYGPANLGVIVLVAGLLQLIMGALKTGRWFRAISASVVHGMLGGIGVVIIVGQTYSLLGRPAHGSGLTGLMGLPGLLTRAVSEPAVMASAGLGVATIIIMVAWRLAPAPLQMIPAPLAAVVLTTGAAALLSVDKIQVKGVLGVLQPPGAGEFARLTEPGVLGTVVALTLIASAESLFSAAAVDRMHDGPRTDYDKELMAQGVGNAACGLLGALPMTAVIVRSAANVQAGAATRASRIMHGGWLLLFAALLPAALGIIPVAVLAGVLIHCGWKLIPGQEVARLWRTERGEALVLVLTLAAIVTTNLLEGVLTGLVLAVAKTAWDVSHIHIDVHEDPGTLRIRLTGNATFLRLPRILDTLEALPHDRPVELDLSGLRHLDHACRTALLAWTAQRDSSGSQVQVSGDLNAVPAA
ncbi:SulP family inorganic anion transporter [Actinomadura scrupuli]|uniref:SulP family inorganic anion transporter n=1 Tax=Actinomadura scrupuli TaxID=559629 RepID=UPI003D967395